MQHNQINFLIWYHQVTLFVYENELKLSNNQEFLLRQKQFFSNKLHFTYSSLHIEVILI